ncbi:MAG: hypothetical protein ACK4MF_02470, partial [Hyphomicrobiaceae bacterium]
MAAVVRTGKPRIMFLYWGRRGALPRFTLDVARAMLAESAFEGCVSVSRQAENFDAFVRLGVPLVPVDTFAVHRGAVT